MKKKSSSDKDTPRNDGDTAGTPWAEYFERIKGFRGVRPLLEQAFPFVHEKGSTLDLGSGALSDSGWLLSQGFAHVTAVDIEPVAQEIADTFPQERFQYIVSSFTDFDFPQNAFDLINAQYSLPFNPADSFEKVFADIIHALKPDGVFVFQLFGKNDWRTSQTVVHTRVEVESLLQGLEIIELKEEESDAVNAAGESVHRHIFHAIARKR